MVISVRTGYFLILSFFSVSLLYAGLSSSARAQDESRQGYISLPLKHPDYPQNRATGTHHPNYPPRSGHGNPRHPNYAHDFGAKDVPVMHPAYPFEFMKLPDWAQRFGDRLIPLDMRVSLHPSPEAERFFIRVGIEKSISSCIEFGAIEYEKSLREGGILLIEILGFSMQETEDSALACQAMRAAPSVDIPMHRSELAGVGRIKFMTGYLSDDYHVSASAGRIEIRPAGQPAHMLPVDSAGQQDPLSVWFLPANVVALEVPSARAGTDLDTVLRDFAQRHGLKPIGEVIRSYPVATLPEGRFYFIDETGDVVRALAGTDLVFVGYVDIERPYRVPSGVTTVSHRAEVVARRL